MDSRRSLAIKWGDAELFFEWASRKASRTRFRHNTWKDSGKLSEGVLGILLLNLGEDEGPEEMLEDKDEEKEENGVDEKVKEVRENAQLMHATWWWPWKEWDANILSLEPLCDVQGMSVTTAKQRLTTKTATLRACSRVLQVF